MSSLRSDGGSYVRTGLCARSGHSTLVCLLAAPIAVLCGCDALPPEDYNPGEDYRLPFEGGTSQILSQGNFGDFTHRDVYALDFALAEGTPVVAARGGTVVDLFTTSACRCPPRPCTNNGDCAPGRRRFPASAYTTA